MTERQRVFISPLEVAKAKGLSERTIRRMIAEGELPAYRIGKRRIGILPEDADKLAVRIPAGDQAAS